MIQGFAVHKNNSFEGFTITENASVKITTSTTVIKPVQIEFRTLGLRGKDGVGADPQFVADTEQRLTNLEQNDGIHNGATYLDYFNLALN